MSQATLETVSPTDHTSNILTAPKTLQDVLPDVKINVFHTLENFLDAYNDQWSVVVLEAIANAIDANATKVDIVLGSRHISFRDDGPGMNKKQFKKYHDISASAKRKGAGIGFAGVGAKIYLAVWKQTVIHTETYGDDGPLVSDLQVTHGKVRWEERPTTTSIKTRGTLYGVKLRENDYKKLESGIHELIRDHFNQKMLDGLRVTINGDRLAPWNPPHERRIRHTVKVKRLVFPATLTIYSDDIPAKYRHVQYHVWGKTITTKKLDWAVEIKEPYKNRIHCMVDANANSKHLKIDKGSFKGGPGAVADMYGVVDKWLHKELRVNGYVDAQSGDVRRSAKMSRFFTNLFKKYRWLNPGAAGGAGPGTGTGSSGAAERDGTTVQKKAVKQPDGKARSGAKRGGSGLSIITTHKDGDPRDGWIDPESNSFVCNTAHPLYRKYEKNAEARNLRVKQVLFGALITHGSKNVPMDVAKAFETHRDLMTEARNLEVPV